MLKRELEYFFGALRFFTRLPVPAWDTPRQPTLREFGPAPNTK